MQERTEVYFESLTDLMLKIISNSRYCHHMDDMPDTPGIYFLTTEEFQVGWERSDHVFYIGISRQSVKRRWLSHHLRGLLSREEYHYCVYTKPLSSSFQTLEEEEAFFVSLLRPVLNKRIGFWLARGELDPALPKRILECL